MPGTSSWFSMKALSASSAEISIYDEIGMWGITASEFKKGLKSLGKVSDITVKLNSPGGSVGDGNAIYNLLKNHKAHVTVDIDSLALSMGSLIAMAGDTIRIAENGMMMIHNPWGVAVGDAEALRKSAEVSDKFKAGMVRIYADRTGMSTDEISALMDDETWLDAEEAVEFGFADEITGRVELAASFDLTGFKHTPEQLLPSGKSGTVTKRKDVMPKQVEVDNTNAPAAQAPAAQAPDLEAAAAEAATKALEAEDKRQEAIQLSFKAYASDHRELLDACLKDRSTTPGDANAKLLTALGEGRESFGGTSRITMGEVGAKFREGAVAALEMRAGVREQDTANEFRAYTMAELCAHSLKMRGVSTAGKSRLDLVGAAFTHSSGDFPLLMENVLGKELQRSHGAFADTWRTISHVTSVQDFRINKRVRLGSFNSLATVAPGDEYTHGTIGEEGESIQAGTKGRMISFTRQAIINDDLGGLMGIATKMGRAAARTVNSDVYATLIANAAMSDGTALFHADHANLAASGATMSVSTLSAAKKAMRMQQDVGKNEYIDVQPTILLVPVALEDLALTLMASETDFAQGNSKKPNIHRGTLTVVSDPRLDGDSATAWYTVAAPLDVPLLEVAFLDGNQTPYLESQNGFTIDGVQWKVRMDYGVSAIDWRGGFKNPGA